MDFNTLIFPLFFAAAAAVYYIFPRIARPYLLLAASYFFYCYKPENRSLVVLLLCATLVTWGCGLAVHEIKNKAGRRIFLLVGIFTCFGLLFTFKYYGFFRASLSELSSGRLVLGALDLAAPLGLSYFLFQALGYTIDCYRGKPVIRNPLLYALFVSFFPCIFTGPIERADHLLPQLTKPRKFDYDRVAGGAFRMLWGYCKKMILADNLAAFVRSYYIGSIAQSGPAAAAAAALFSLQLYFDFSGCCDIAIGGARLFGVELLENFDNPFLSVSYSELWRRWHMSLTGWFRDYLYIPLGGSRCSLSRWALNFMLVFVFSGLWHGAAPGYFWWGVLCGVLVLAVQLPKKVLARRSPSVRHSATAMAAGRHTGTVPVRTAAASAGRHAKSAASSHGDSSAAVRVPAAVAAGADGTAVATYASTMDDVSAVPCAEKAPADAASSARNTFSSTKAKRSPVVVVLCFFRDWVLRILVFAEFSVCFILFAAALYGAGGDFHPIAALLQGWNAANMAQLTASAAACGLEGMRGSVLLGGTLLVFLVESRGNVAEWVRRRFILWRWALYAVLVAALLFFGAFGESAFIYQMY